MFFNGSKERRKLAAIIGESSSLLLANPPSDRYKRADYGRNRMQGTGGA